MGLTCSIEDKVNELVFQPPQLDPTNIKMDNIIFITYNNNTVPILHLKPIIGNKYIIWSHGNASNIHTMEPYLLELHNHLKVGIIAYDYQGYGLSNGQVSESNCYHDLEATVNFVLNQLGIKQSDITLIGQSLGTGVVIDYLAKHDWFSPAILISPYKSISRVVTEPSSISCISYLADPLDKFKSCTKITKVKCPIRIIHGTQDTLIDISHAKYLYDQLPDKSLTPIWIKRAGHNDILNKIKLRHIKEVIIKSY